MDALTVTKQKTAFATATCFKVSAPKRLQTQKPIISKDFD